MRSRPPAGVRAEAHPGRPMRPNVSQGRTSASAGPSGRTSPRAGPSGRPWTTWPRDGRPVLHVGTVRRSTVAGRRSAGRSRTGCGGRCRRGGRRLGPRHRGATPDQAGDEQPACEHLSEPSMHGVLLLAAVRRLAPSVGGACKSGLTVAGERAHNLRCRWLRRPARGPAAVRQPGLSPRTHRAGFRSGRPRPQRGTVRCRG
jgi:hypothetical protein